ncbi:MAG TPA: PspC domain-containing protein [Propionicimonas sp.]|nr:PspC domain-containing protein [Propionicimonas sp.]HRA07114.1 PspC domain-containing protein [Propionicimonas sp.]
MSEEVVHPRSTRPLAEAWVGGVCAGLADHLGWSVLLLRVLFVVAGALGLVGVALYLALWLVMPRAIEQRDAPGLEAGARKGLRPAATRALTAVDLGVASALALLGVGLAWLVQVSGYGPPNWLVSSGMLAGIGLGIIWWQADHVSTRELRTGTGWQRLVAPLVAHWTSIVAILAGLAALGGAIWLVLVAQSALSEVARTVLLLALAITSLALAALPWVLRVRRALAQARDDALVADARADMAAHLHDSVLQTLALIQRKASDPKAVTALARRQERELRQWLYADSSGRGTLTEAIAAEIIDVEDRHGVDIELVSVGDTELTPELAALVKASREAMVNAAKHSGAQRIDVYVEADPELVSVYVRDRGAGFDLAHMDADRMGVRGSIIERVKRAGGRAIIRTAPEEGTEVRLELPR